MSTTYICGTAEAARVVEFCTQVGYVKSQHNDDYKSPLQGVWSGSRDPL